MSPFSDHNLSRRHPNLHQEAGLFSLTSRAYGRSTLRPSKVEVDRVFTLSPDQVPEQIKAGEKEVVIVGIVVQASDAEDADNVFTISNGQAGLLTEAEDGTEVRYPIGWSYRRESRNDYSPLDKRDEFVRAKSGVGEAKFDLYYLLPKGETPYMLRLKQLPLTLEDAPEITRDDLANYLADTRWVQPEKADDDNGQNNNAAASNNNNNASLGSASGSGAFFEGGGLRFTNNLPQSYNKNNVDSGCTNLKYSKIGQSDNGLVSARGRVSTESKQRVRANLAVKEFYHPANNQIVQVVMAEDKARTMFGQAMSFAAQTQAPVLIDTDGDSYQAIGYILYNRNRTYFDIDPDNKMRAISQIDRDRMDEDDEVILIFSVGSNVRTERVPYRPRDSPADHLQVTASSTHKKPTHASGSVFSCAVISIRRPGDARRSGCRCRCSPPPSG